MKINTRFVASPFSVALFHVCSLLVVLPTATAQDVEFVVAELGGVSVVSIPQPSPIPELLATKVVLRTAAENTLVTFENVKISGAVHQICWVPGLSVHAVTPFVDPSPFSFWFGTHPEWMAADSHVLISPDMVASGVGGGHRRISESNDRSNPVGANRLLPPIDRLGQIQMPTTGIGDTQMLAETDSFSLHTEFQTNEIEFAYVVTPAASIGAAGEIFLTVGILAEGLINSGEPGGASFGFNGNDSLVIPFVPEPSAAVLAVVALASDLPTQATVIGRHGAASLCGGQMNTRFLKLD